MKKMLEALGVEALPEESFRKLLNDHLVLARAQNLMYEFFTPTAIQQMHPLEKAALLKRIGPPLADNKVRWIVSRALHSGRPNIIARYRNEEIFFDGRPENAPLVEFHGEHPSADILAQYSAAYDPTNTPQMDPAFWKVRWAKDQPRFSSE